jgi:DNA-binding LytR/AlgR family response regulator
MKIVIVEDEKYTSDLILRLVRQYDPEIQILKVLSNVEESVDWFKGNNTAADLILMDVQLTDGESFDIFRQVQIETPVVFITAYNQYAINAFRVNSIDYLLKPLDYSELERAFDKYLNLKRSIAREEPQFYNKIFANGIKPYKSRFLIKVGEHYKFIKVSSIAYFIFEEGVVLAQLDNSGRQIVDESLDELEGLLDPEKFYRLNRKVVASIDAIGSIQNYFNRRLSVRLLPNDRQEIISRERVAGFKAWMNL